MSVKSGIAEIRASRKLILTATDPFSWELLSTDGSYKHHLIYDENRLDVACLTCEANYRSNKCWARARVLDDLEQRFGPAKPPRAPEAAPEPVPEPEPAIGSMSWHDLWSNPDG